MTFFERLSERWGGSLWPELTFDSDTGMIERWDTRGEGKGYCLAFEGFGLSFSLFFGRTPDVRHD